MNTDYDKLLEDFGHAFNQHDAAALVSMMTDGAVFYTVAGDTENGNAIIGREAIQRAFTDVWTNMPDAHWEAQHIFTKGNSGLSQWLFTGTNKRTGETIKAQGCDVFTFKNGKIAIKNAFRKQIL